MLNRRQVRGPRKGSADWNEKGFVTKKSFYSEWIWSAHVHDLSPDRVAGRRFGWR
jgi:hypothetical protein